MEIDLEGQLLATRPGAERVLAALGRHPLLALRRILSGQGISEQGVIREDLLPLRLSAVQHVKSALDNDEPVTCYTTLDMPAARSVLARHGLEEVELRQGPPPEGTPLAVVPRRSPLDVRPIFKALRPHQWVKNILLFVPMLAAHKFDMASLVTVLWGIAAFSAAASSIYLVNDLLDIDADRQHPTKCRRPFAAGTLSVSAGLFAFLALVMIALGIGWVLGPAFLGVVVLYIGLSIAYSFKLKRMRWIDIATLAALYTIRVIAGAAALGVAASGYLLVFIFPVFLTLGSVKRLTELTLAKTDDRLPGRGYGRRDRGDLLNVAGLATFAAVLNFFLYSFTEQAMSLYPIQWLMWVAVLPVTAWLVRMVWLGYAGKQDYDPIIFAMRDRYGLTLLILTLILLFYSAGIIPQLPRP